MCIGKKGATYFKRRPEYTISSALWENNTCCVCHARLLQPMCRIITANTAIELCVDKLCITTFVISRNLCHNTQPLS